VVSQILNVPSLGLYSEHILDMRTVGRYAMCALYSLMNNTVFIYCSYKVCPGSMGQFGVAVVKKYHLFVSVQSTL
jgi:hypothetical protein